MRIVFMGTPDFSVPVLEALVEAGHEIACVYCQPPRPAGRGKKERLTPVHTRAEALGLTVRHPVSLRTAQAQDDFAALNADIAVVVAYGLILPPEILAAPLRGCLNIHASLLPRWRGAAPIHRAIMAGDAQTGICIMQMNEGLDTGDVLLRQSTEIADDDTTGSLHDRLCEMGAEAIVTTLAGLDRLVPVPQPDEGVTYAEKIDKAEARIDWTAPAVDVDRKIRGLSPFPGAWCVVVSGEACGEASDERLKLLNSRVAEGSAAPGTRIGPARIACGDGAIDILRAQRQGKRAMDIDDLLLGYDLPEHLS